MSGAVQEAGVARLALASRGDALTPYLFDALERAYPVAGRLDVELQPWQRALIAAATFRPSRSDWVERFYKSGFANRMRSANGSRALHALPEKPDLLLQVHALFGVPEVPSALYIDTTHRQSADHWPDWNPLTGRALANWYGEEQRVYDRAAHLFAFCEPTAASLRDDYGQSADRVSVVGAGVNFDRLPETAHREPPDGPPTILFIGNDWRRKGGFVLLEAFRRVRAAVPDARLVLVGTRPPIDAEPGVEILGRVQDRARIAGLYASASLFVVPSYFDPYPLVLLEAMAFGLPVVATGQAGVPEMVESGRTGTVVPAGDVPALADAMLQVLRDPQAAAIQGAAARRSIEERFTWDSVVDRMSPVLDRLLAGAQATAASPSG